MVKSTVMNYIQLGDTVSDINHSSIKGVVTVICRNTQDVMQVSLESWNEENNEMLSQDVYLSDCIGEKDETFCTDPLQYGDYFPTNDTGYLFELNKEYFDIYTKFKGLASNHAVCITGCDRTQLKFTKQAKEGLFSMWIDLNRIQTATAKTVEETCADMINEDRKQPGGPLEETKDIF